MVSAAELVAVLILVLLSLAAPRVLHYRLRSVDRGFRRLARRTGACLLLLFGLVLGLELTLAAVAGVPQPAVHDEFAYLLSADTFARGRLTNPTPPLAEHFRAHQVLLEPSYQAKYPPGQGLVLACGQLLCGEPIVAVWVLHALSCAGVYWMLRGWVPPRWALWGGLLAAAHYGLMTRWAMGYWGGSLAMLGGVLAFGAVPRIACRTRVADGFILGCGLAIWVHTRPYEGLLASLVIGVHLLVGMLRQRADQRAKERPAFGLRLARVAAPAALVLLPTLLSVAVYNRAVTGEMLTFPYQAWHAQVLGDRWMQHTLFGDLAAVCENPLAALRGGLDLSRHGSLAAKLARNWGFYLSPAVIPAVLAALTLWRCGKARFALLALLVVFAAILSQRTAGHTHYSAPVCVLIFAALVLGFRRLRGWRWNGRPAGRPLATLLPAAAVCFGLVAMAVEWPRRPYPPGHAWSLERAAVAKRLAGQEGQHLVFVRYSPRHIRHFEWVYNRADLDAAGVVWARDLGPVKNARLQRRFAGRRVWVVEADAARPQLTPLTPVVLRHLADGEPSDATQLASRSRQP